MLVLDQVGKTYPNGVNALERFSATINRGEIVAVIGGSGCGKSTLLRAIAGLDRASRGSITLDGDLITAPHGKIGIIFQEPRLLPWLSVADNVAFGLAGLPKRERAGRVARALDRVGLADKAVAESRERVRAALTASGLALPARRITVNLAPADMPKEGSHYDLPIALAVMAAIGALTATSSPSAA